ncbi:hypothetical protein WJX74_001925 [Apatococcus lobatus]|uniref:Uncharacterized protein n=1 Tax=Apatococcus lobatus TaxID=904363 RepID=A0AAW1Q986_9CHLO
MSFLLLAYKQSAQRRTAYSILASSNPSVRWSGKVLERPPTFLGQGIAGQMAASEDEFGLEDSELFTPVAELQEFTAGQRSLQLYCSPAASTDYDETGTILWPAAQMLADYLAQHEDLLHGRNAAIELGSGIGLVGMLASLSCRTVLTDHNAHVLNVLRRSAQNFSRQNGSQQATCARLDWGNSEEIAHLRSLAPGGQGYDLVLGADVCYSLSALSSLFSTAAQLLSKGSASAFLLGYVSRASNIDRALAGKAAEASLTMVEVPDSTLQLCGSWQGCIYICHCLP